MKDAKNWLFKKPNKQIKLHACLSKITPRALIGQKVNNGDSCFTSVSSNHKSKHRHADNSYCQILTSQPTTKYDSLHNTEVSQDNKSSDKHNKLKRQNLKPLGNKSTPLLKSSDERPSWLLSKDKVRKLTNVLYLKTKNTVRHIRSLKRKVLTGTSMGKVSKKPGDGDEKSNENEGEKPQEKGHKDLRKRVKKSKPKSAKQDVVNPYNLKEQIAGVIKTIDKRSSSKTLEDEEVRKHMEAIQASVNKSSGPRRSPRKQKKSQIAAPVSPQKTAPRVPDNAVPKTPERIDTSDVSRVPGTSFFKFTSSPSKNRGELAKRKRGDIKTETDSDSSEPRKRLTKKAKKSCIQETSEESSSSEDLDDSPTPNELPRAKHRRIQMEIRSDKVGSRETRVRLNNRTNILFEPVTLKSGRKVTRRNPKKKFKPKPKKPANGASITNHAPGKMLKAIRIMLANCYGFSSTASVTRSQIEGYTRLLIFRKFSTLPAFI